MATARWAHFACHASPDAANPSGGYLLLEDSQDRRLTVADVSRLRLDDAEFAFLSACSTARPSQHLADEAIHLASAFQLAGYRHVIGTLWPIYDRVARSIADDLYAAIARSGTAMTASALHSVTRDLRDRRTDAPSLWASHIHSGA
jgi:CHAT domain-containing protein